MTDYKLLCRQLELFAEEDPGFVPLLSNASALLWEALPDINWAGFYLVMDKHLVLGPFQGKPACIHIEYGKGVCGTAWASDETQLVADVHQFPGHIACDSASNSEIVVPIHFKTTKEAVSGAVTAVLDIDSPLFSRFDETDKAGLEAFVKLLEAVLSYNMPAIGIASGEAPRTLDVLRTELEQVDAQLLALFEQSMELSREVGRYKKEKGLPILDSAKEAQKIQAAKNSLPEGLRESGARFQQLLMDLGKEVQRSI